jgi:hypothetical protein
MYYFTSYDRREFQIKVAKYKPLKGSSYIELPKKYQNANYKLINMKNYDNECFKWCIGRSDCMDQKPKERVSQRVKEAAEKYNWKGITFPTSLNQMNKFERQNDVAVSVYGLDKLELYPLRITKVRKEKHEMLLLIEYEGKKYYVILQDLNPFVDKKRDHKTYPCPYCLHSFMRKELLVEHEPNCVIHTPARMDLCYQYRFYTPL